MARNTNNGGGSQNHLSASSSLQDSTSGQDSGSGQRDGVNASKMLPPIGFVVFAVIIWLLCSRVLRTYTEEQEQAGGGDNETTVRQLQSNEAGDGSVDRAPSSAVAAVEMMPVWKVEPPLVCTYQKADGWREGSCGVCLADMADGEAIRVLPECMHYFHAACVGEWLCTHHTCPLCRAPLVAPAGDAT